MAETKVSFSENGIIPDKPDYRDIPVGIAMGDKPLPRKVDNRDKQSAIKDQGGRNTCAAFAGVAALEYYNRAEHKNPTLDLSEQFFYDWAKKIDGFDGSGTYARIAAKVAKEHGACLEAIMPYEPNAAEDVWKVQEPTDFAIKDAKKYRMKSYAYIPVNLEKIKRAVYEFDIAFGGLRLYGDFMQSTTNGGWFLLPEDKKIEYGHLLLFVGYDDDMVNPYTQEKGAFIMKNAWGENTGDKGYYFVSYSYIKNPHAHSFYTFIDLTKLNMAQPFTDKILEDMPWAWEALQYFKDEGDIKGYPDGSLQFSVEAIRLKVSDYNFYKRKGLL